jgi:hypothetical protein
MTVPAPVSSMTNAVLPSGVTAMADSECPTLMGVPRRRVARLTGMMLSPAVT